MNISVFLAAVSFQKDIWSVLLRVPHRISGTETVLQESKKNIRISHDTVLFRTLCRIKQCNRHTEARTTMTTSNTKVFHLTIRSDRLRHVGTESDLEQAFNSLRYI